MDPFRIFKNQTIRENQQRIETDPNDAEAHFLLGVEYDRLGKYQQAIGAFKEVLRVNPKSAEAYFNLALLYNQTNEGREAIRNITLAGNLFSQKNQVEKKDQARKMLHEFHARFQLSPTDLTQPPDAKKDI